MSKRPDSTLVDLIRSDLWAHRKCGTVHPSFKPSACTLAAMALEACGGNLAQAKQMLTTSVMYLHKAEQEQELPVVSTPPMAANDSDD